MDVIKFRSKTLGFAHSIVAEPKLNREYTLGINGVFIDPANKLIQRTRPVLLGLTNSQSNYRITIASNVT